MREIERNRNRREALRGEPLVPEIIVRPQGDSARRKLAIELLDTRHQFAVLDPDAQIADAQREQFFVLEPAPKWLGGRLHLYIVTCWHVQFHQATGEAA